MEDEIVVTKRLVAREELVITKRTVTEEKIFQETVRREHAQMSDPAWRLNDSVLPR